MQKSRYGLSRSINFRKSVSWYVLSMLLVASFTAVVLIVTAEGENDVITTYCFEGFLDETTDFTDNETVYVNLTVDLVSGDPDPFWYNITAVNTNSGEWVFVPVSDNTSIPCVDNTADDKKYWGCFNVSSTEATQNSSGPGIFSILHVSDGDTINITETPLSPLDGDLEIASIFIIITADGEGGNNPPEIPHHEEPSNESTDRPININISWNCSDPDGDPLTFDIYFGNSTPPSQVWSDTSNMSYNPGNLEYNTTYYWYIVAWDNQSANTTSPFWWFHTQSAGPGGEPGPGPDGNGTGTIRGFVNNSEGMPLEGVTIMLNRTDEGQPVEFVRTNMTGEYIFDNNVTQGSYDVEAWKEGYEPHTVNNISVFENETSWVPFTLGSPGGPGGQGDIDIDEWQSSLSPAYIMNNTQGKFNFTIKAYGPAEGKIYNLTILFPEDFTYIGNNGTTVSDPNYVVYNTENSVVWQKTNDDGFHLNEDENFWFNASSNASLGSDQFIVIICIDENQTHDPLSFTIFTTTSFYHTGTIFDITGQPLQGAAASVSSQSFSMNGPVNLGSFTGETNETGFYNVTDIPTTIENVNDLNWSEFMGSGGMDGMQINYQLSAADYNSVYTDLATYVSPSLPYVPLMEFVRLLDEPEIYLKPALSFRVNVTGPIYSWNQENHTMEVATGLKNFSLMVKDQRLGFQVKELNTRSEEKTFSVPQDRDYSFTICADQSFPLSVKFDDILEICQGDQNFNLTGVTTQVMPYNDTYLINVTIDASYVSRWLNGTFNNITDLLEMRVVVYNMEYQGDTFMVFENWAMPYNLDNEFRNGTDDQYDLTTKEYNISLPATNASSSLLLRAYARNATGYYMGSAIINASGQTLSQETINFDMEKLIQGDYSINRTVTSSNVSNNWSQTTIVNTVAMLFNLVKDGELLDNENPFVEVKRELDGTIYNQMIDGSGGQFNLSLTEGEDLYKLTIYSQQYAPISTSVSADVISGETSTDTVSCENGQCNITMREFGDYDPLGKNATMMMIMYKSNETCNVPNPPAFCDLCASDDEEDGPFGEDGNMSGKMSKDEFSPFAAILKGDISMMIESETSNGTIYVYYINVDLLASGPPDASFSTDAQDAQDGLSKAWQFGSQGPEIYDYVLIGIPVEDDVINKTIKVTIPLLYDNEYNIIWNESAGDDIDAIYNDSTLFTLYGDYLDTPYEAYLNGTGVICNASDPTLASGLGYKDIDDKTIWIKIPHFSGLGPEITGEEPEPPTNFAITINSTTENYLTWTKAGNADYTYIERNETGQTSWSKGSGIEIYNETGEEYSDIGLTEGLTYYYQAWSWNQTNGYWSITNATSTYHPNTPTDLSATAASSSSISLSWTKGNFSDKTRIQRKTGSYPTSISDGSNVYNGTGTSTTSTGLSSSTKYYYSAWAWNDTNNVWSIAYDIAYATTNSAGGNNNPGGDGDDEEETEDDTVNETIDTNEDVDDSENETEPAEISLESSNTTIDTIYESYGLNLSKGFYANDTNGDSKVDTFADPNEQLNAISSTQIDDNVTFLISIDDDEIPEFLWNAETDEIIEITHTPGTVQSEKTDDVEETITVTITIDKANWVYIEIDDNYPDYDVTVTASDGRVIESDKIWRENGKIYVLDDPDVEYDFIYDYTGHSLPESDTPDDKGFVVPWFLWIILVVSVILVIIGILFKTGFLYIEKTKKK